MVELLRTRRSIRKYENREVEQEKIDQLLKAALLAPSSRARRPWEFIAVTDKGTLTKLSQCRENSSQFIAGAPLAIVVIADNQLSDVWIEDSTIAAAIMHLTAHSMGLGSCWVQVRERMHDEEKTAEEYIKDLLHIPDRFSVECIIAAGYPGEEKKPYDYGLQYEKVHFNSY